MYANYIPKPLKHATWCEECEKKYCYIEQEVDDDSYLQLKDDYKFIEIMHFMDEKYYDELNQKTGTSTGSYNILDIKVPVSGKYYARILDGGLDLKYSDNNNKELLTDQIDWNCHEFKYNFERIQALGDSDDKCIEFTINSKDSILLKFLGESSSGLFIGREDDFKKFIKSTEAPFKKIRCLSRSNLFDKTDFEIFEIENVGYIFSNMPVSYDAYDTELHSDEGFYNQAYFQYSNLNSNEFGIIFTGKMHSYHFNNEEGIDMIIDECETCEINNPNYIDDSNYYNVFIDNDGKYKILAICNKEQ